MTPVEYENYQLIVSTWAGPVQFFYSLNALLIGKLGAQNLLAFTITNV